MRTRLTLIRHGESKAQLSAICSGHDTCEGLSDLGKRQAGALRDRLLATRELDPVDVLYTSILHRARETADIIAPGLTTGLEPQAECEWCEIHPGEAEGMTWEEITERYPLRAAWTDPYVRRLPGGESWAEFYVRAGARLRRVADEHEGQHTVVVCHGGIVGASFVALGDLPAPKGFELTIEARNTSITEWAHGRSGWRLVRYNDAAHLATLEP